MIPRENIFMLRTRQMWGTKEMKTIKRAPLAGTRPALEEQSSVNTQGSPSSAATRHVGADIPAVLSSVAGFMALTLVSARGWGHREHQPKEAFDLKTFVTNCSSCFVFVMDWRGVPGGAPVL